MAPDIYLVIRAKDILQFQASEIFDVYSFNFILFKIIFVVFFKLATTNTNQKVI